METTPFFSLEVKNNVFTGVICIGHFEASPGCLG